MNLTTYICEDLKRRIESGACSIGLTTTGLARRYQVSTTPVRRALQHLADEGVVCQQPNGRWAVHPRFAEGGIESDGKRAPTLVDSTGGEPGGRGEGGEGADVGEAWRDEVVRDLLIRSLCGSGGFVREAAMAEQFGIGRTRVRRVFHHMTACGVLEHVPRRGWRLRVFQESDMEAYVDVREILELRALDLARNRLDRAVVEQMLEGNREAPEVRLDNRLHRYFVDCSGNRYIQTFFRTQGQYYRLLFDYAALEGRVIETMAAQHRAILEYVLRGRWRQARKALAEHIRAQVPVMKRLVEQLRATG